MKKALNWPEIQAELRANGLLADAHEPYVSPEGLRLDALPQTFSVERRQRGDRVTRADAARIGIKERRKRSGARR